MLLMSILMIIAVDEDVESSCTCKEESCMWEKKVRKKEKRWPLSIFPL